jgi:hypothetical protein
MNGVEPVRCRRDENHPPPHRWYNGRGVYVRIEWLDADALRLPRPPRGRLDPVVSRVSISERRAPMSEFTSEVSASE